MRGGGKGAQEHAVANRCTGEHVLSGSRQAGRQAGRQQAGRQAVSAHRPEADSHEEAHHLHITRRQAAGGRQLAGCVTAGCRRPLQGFPSPEPSLS
jgi:hypothetical protein